MLKKIRELPKHVQLTIIVAALGYFVDIYDLLLFSIVRYPSLKDLGIPESEILEKGVLLINSQMAGLLLGGIIWGVLGDKKGRLSVLFGSIFLYSTANIANAFITSIEAYTVLRFIAGVGLAGELGAGVTLVSELMPKETRSYGTTLIATVGILGAVVAALVGDYLTWKVSYIVGGVMGFALLALRIGIYESSLFTQMKATSSHAGHFLLLFKSRKNLLKYTRIILIGVPIWFTIGILITFSPEFGSAFSMSEIPSAGMAVMYSYIGLAIGDFSSGLLSQYLQSRKKVFALFLCLLTVSIASYFIFARHSLFYYYSICLLIGFSGGYWAIFITSAAEQFGTNIRATVATTAPNFVRGAVIPITIAFKSISAESGIITGAIAVGSITLLLAFTALFGLEESFKKDLNYLEEYPQG